ncbi:MAG: 3TM-type holin [Geminicoccaceae bacterium]
MLKSLISWVTGSTVGAVAKGVETVGGVFAENKEKKGQRSHRADMAVLEQFSAEFRNVQGRTRWDSFVDGLNRLPRPLITLGILGMFILAPYDPVRFLEIATAYQVMPDGFWALLSIIIAFYFGGRMQMSSQNFNVKGGALEAAKDMIEQRRAFRELMDDEDQAPGVDRSEENRVIKRWLERKPCPDDRT